MNHGWAPIVSAPNIAAKLAVDRLQTLLLTSNSHLEWHFETMYGCMCFRSLQHTAEYLNVNLSTRGKVNVNMKGLILAGQALTEYLRAQALAWPKA